MRKTIPVVTALARANYFLANSPDDEARERQATANLLETLLHAANAYRGFRFTGLDKATYDADGYPITGTYDETRRQYLVHRALEDDLRAENATLGH